MYRAALEHTGYDLYEANSGEAALDRCVERKYDALIIGLQSSDMDGFDLLESMYERDIRTPAVLVMEDGDVPNPVRAMELGAIDFLPKPPPAEQLRQVVNDILIRHIPDPRVPDVRDCGWYLGLAKRSINLRDFNSAKAHLIKALDMDPHSIQAIHLVGVMLEMREEHEQSISVGRR